MFADVEHRERRKLQLREAFVDLEVYPVPLPDRFVLWHPLGGPYHAMRILDDRGGMAAAVVANTLEAYEAGPERLNDADYQNRRICLAKAVLKLSDLTEEPLLSFSYMGTIFWAAYTYWFAVRGQWPLGSEPEALAHLREHDPAYFAQVEVLVGGGTTSEKLEAARWISGALFGPDVGRSEKPAALVAGA